MLERSDNRISRLNLSEHLHHLFKHRTLNNRILVWSLELLVSNNKQLHLCLVRTLPLLFSQHSVSINRLLASEVWVPIPLQVLLIYGVSTLKTQQSLKQSPYLQHSKPILLDRHQVPHRLNWTLVRHLTPQHLVSNHQSLTPLQQHLLLWTLVSLSINNLRSMHLAPQELNKLLHFLALDRLKLNRQAPINLLVLPYKHHPLVSLLP